MSAVDVAGLCECGCGQPTRLAPQTNRALGWIKGKPIRFIVGHARRGQQPSNKLPIDSGFVVEDRGYETPCHVWQRSLNSGGYAQVNRGGRPQSVVRIRYEAKYGPMPASTVPDHLCRVRACVNPDHVEPVSMAVNTQRGDCAKLTADDVRAIRTRRAAGERLRVIAADFGVSDQAVSDIARRKRWANVA